MDSWWVLISKAHKGFSDVKSSTCTFSEVLKYKTRRGYLPREKQQIKILWSEGYEIMLQLIGSFLYTALGLYTNNWKTFFLL